MTKKGDEGILKMRTGRRGDGRKRGGGGGGDDGGSRSSARMEAELKRTIC